MPSIQHAPSLTPYHTKSMPIKPFHVLLLPGANTKAPKSLKRQARNDDDDDDLLVLGSGLGGTGGAGAETQDYLSQRHSFRKRKSSRKSGETASSFVKVEEGDATNNIQKEPLKNLASRLELALASCCERVPSEKEKEPNSSSSPSTSPEKSHRSRLHRPICPSNYPAPEPSPSDTNADRSHPHSPIKKYESKPPIHPSDDENTTNSKPSKAGVLMKGKEGHFTALLMNCGDVGHRALAIAILKRTVEFEAWEAKQMTAKSKQKEEGETNGHENKREDVGSDVESAIESEASESMQTKTEEDESSNKASKEQEDSEVLQQSASPLQPTPDPVSSSDATGNKPHANDGADPSAECDKLRTNLEKDTPKGDMQPRENMELSNDKEMKKVQHCRIKTFLAAGGMKILARWLADSFTPVIQTTPPTKPQKPSFSHNSTKPTHTPSPTGPLILPILALLPSIPFDKDAILAANINKSIKRLKKALDAVVEGLEKKISNQQLSCTGSEESLSRVVKQKVKLALEEEVHPVAGGLPIGKVKQAVERLMRVWNTAASAADSSSNASNDSDDSDDISPDGDLDPFQKLRREMASRFDELTAFRSEGGDAAKAPSWMPHTVIEALASVSPAKVTSNPSSPSLPKPNWSLPKSTSPTSPEADSISINEKAAKIAREQRTLEELLAKKRKEAASLLESRRLEKMQKLNRITLSSSTHDNHDNSSSGNATVTTVSGKTSSKKVQWVDRPLKVGTPARPLTQERIFVKEEIEEEDDVSCGQEKEGEESQKVDDARDSVGMDVDKFLEDCELEDMCGDSNDYET